jgi:nicotinamide-nucleotide amidase
VPTDDDVELIARIARERGLWVAVAKSFTSGAVASRLGAGPEAAEWFRGGVVAYDESVKLDVLGVTPGPLVTERCARELAVGASRLLGADATIGITGVGGPEPSEGESAGTVVTAVQLHNEHLTRVDRWPCDPGDVIAASTQRAISPLAEVLSARPR